MDKNLLLEYLFCRRAPMTEQEGAIHLHSVLCETAPHFYARLLSDPVTDISHKREILVNLLWNPAGHEVARQRILAELYTLPFTEALDVVSVIRLQRINRSRARALVLAFLLGHEQFPLLAATRKQRVTHLLKHALGEQTWSAAKRFLAHSTPEGEAFLQRELLRYAWREDTTQAREVLCFLAGVPFKPTDPALAKSVAAREELEQGQGLPLETLLGMRGIFHKQVPVGKVRHLAATRLMTRSDEPLTALYKEVFLETAGLARSAAIPEQKASPSAALYQAFAPLFAASDINYDLAGRLAQAVEAIPLIAGRLAIVLDLSASMLSSGERLYHPAALALALTRLLQERVQEVILHQVGGAMTDKDDQLPQPQGATDIASALLAAARQQPQAIVVITDGYENVRQGDTTQVVHGLRLLGLQLPNYQVVPPFTAAEKLTQRRLSEEVPVLPLAHEDGVREVLAYTLLAKAQNPLTPEELEQLQKTLLAR